MIKVLYKAMGMLVSVLGGILAGAIFKKVWKLAAGQDQAPQATDAHRGWPEVLLAAGLQGAIFAVVKAAPPPTTRRYTASSALPPTRWPPPPGTASPTPPAAPVPAATRPASHPPAVPRTGHDRRPTA